jgi:tRNA(Ser,Leu) C12 N-acetylase TAN1
VHLLVTCQSGFEVEAKRELEEMLGEGSVRMTYFRGLLKVNTKQEDAISLLRDKDTSYISRAIPIQKTVNADMESIKKFFENTKIEGTFAARCKRRGTHEFSSKDVEIEAGNMITGAHSKVDLDNPETILWVDIIQDKAHLSILRKDDIIKKTPVVQRRWKKGERPVSRAELKMREIMAANPGIFTPDKVALDIGAAPGGWTRAMASELKKVIAVDRAKLDPGVMALPNILYIKERAENLDLDEHVDIIANDANLLHMQSAQISLELADKYLSDGGVLIHTVKFGVTPKTGTPAAKSLNHAAGEVKSVFESAGITCDTRKLKHNTRNEATIIGRK